MRIHLFVFSIFGLFQASAEASVLKAHPRIATGPVKAALAEVEAKLPPLMKKALGETYTVDVDSVKMKNKICGGTTDFDELVRRDPFTSRRRILLNVGLLQVLGGTQKCDSSSGQELVVAALIHELAHLYDRSDFIWDNPVDKNELKSCRFRFKKEKGRYTSAPTPVCKYYLEARHKISDSLNYRSLADFKGQRQESKNELLGRIGNPQELTSVQEHFALNLTQYLLDSSYACRRPALNTFFERLTQAQAFPEGSCQKTTSIYTSSGGWKFDIDPKKVYQLHFLFASKGEEMVSRWGHSMLRLVTCAPERTHVGPECLEDVAYHIVLSYRANVDDVIVNNWDGLRGKYPSQLMIFALSEIVEEYTRGQWRDLISLPLNFSEAQKELLVLSALEHYWSYSGSYKFLSNNCATEADQLVRAVLPKHHPYHSTHSLTPLGMYKDLDRYGLTNRELLVDKDRARSFGHFFPSQKGILDKAFVKVKDKFRSYKDIAELASRSTAAERRAVYEALEAFDEIGAAYLLEKYTSGVVERELQARIARSLQLDRTTDVTLAKSIENLVAAGQNRLPWKFGAEGYGIPLAQELATDEEVTKRYHEGSLYIAQYREGLLHRFPELTQELNGVKANMELLTNRRRF